MGVAPSMTCNALISQGDTGNLTMSRASRVMRMHARVHVRANKQRYQRDRVTYGNIFLRSERAAASELAETAQEMRDPDACLKWILESHVDPTRGGKRELAEYIHIALGRVPGDYEYGSGLPPDALRPAAARRPDEKRYGLPGAGGAFQGKLE